MSEPVPDSRTALPAHALIAVVTGGISRERDRSLLSGRTAAEALTALGHQVRLMDTRDPGFVPEIVQADVAFLAIAGRHAEDGKLQGFLETLDVPYTGSGVLPSALGMHKPAAKAMVAAAGVPVLPHILIHPGDEVDSTAKAQEIAERLTFPVIVKPVGEGGSVGMSVVHDLDHLEEIISHPPTGDEPLMVEPFIDGATISVGVLHDRGEITALPALAISADREFYDYQAKRDPTLHTYQCPAPVGSGTTAALEQAACQAHRVLGCTGYSRSDFVLGPDGIPWWLEINTLPGLSHTGNLAVMAQAAGITYEQLLTHILATACHRRGYRS